jgi:dephospho-CoA kinase
MIQNSIHPCTNKVYAITGEIGSGKSTALYAFGRMGARFLSQDHIIFKHFGTNIVEDQEVIDVLQKHIDDYRKAEPSVPLFIEIHLWILAKKQISVDQIIVISANRQKRRERIAKRGGYPVEYTNYLTDPYGIGFGSDRAFLNNKDKLDLWRKLEKYYKKIVVPKMVVPQINWEEKL